MVGLDDSFRQGESKSPPTFFGSESGLKDGLEFGFANPLASIFHIDDHMLVGLHCM